MTDNKPDTANRATTVVASDQFETNGKLKNIGGSQSDKWNITLANQATNALWLKNSDKEKIDQQCGATVAALMGIGPRDELEAMMATQLLGSPLRNSRRRKC